jgi:hypothetical protein
MKSKEYIPGVSNIGREEINKRLQFGVVAILITIVSYFLLVYFDVSKAIRFLLFIPATISSVGFLQARMRFCVYYGMAAMFNFDRIGKTHIVENDENIRKDKKRARQIIYYSILIGMAVGIMAVLI